VPREFYKGSDTCRGRILSAEKLWRYRSDIIVREHCTHEQLDALAELDACLANPHLILTTRLPEKALFLLDNSRFFHGRTRIFDANRWLKASHLSLFFTPTPYPLFFFTSTTTITHTPSHRLVTPPTANPFPPAFI